MEAERRKLYSPKDSRKVGASELELAISVDPSVFFFNPYATDTSVAKVSSVASCSFF